MDDTALLKMIQTQAICVDLDFKSTGDRDKTIAPDIRKEIMAFRDQVRNAFFDNSIEFGFRRLILASQFERVVMAAGAARQGLKNKLSEVTEDQAAGFTVTMMYEPVPRGEGFASLPDHFCAQLTKTCDNRQIENFYEGMDNALSLCRSCMVHYVTKLTEFDAWVKGPGGGKSVVLRSVVVERAVTLLNIINTYNAMGSERYNRVMQYAGPVMSSTIDEVRKDTAKRDQAIQYGTAVLNVLNELVGVADEDETDDATE